MMDNLPAPRVTPHREFLHCDIDFSGPFGMKSDQQRKPQALKPNLCLFISLTIKAVRILTIKAVYIKHATSLTTDTFRTTLSRFIARRGCYQQSSDGSTKYLNEFYTFLPDKATKLQSNSY